MRCLNAEKAGKFTRRLGGYSAPASTTVFRLRMDYAQITSRLFVGSCPRTIDDIERLRQDLVITAILSLQTDEDMTSINLNWRYLEPITALLPLTSFACP
jgi:hypothetical protein